MSKNKKVDRLTELVVEYKKTKKELLLIDILKLTEGSIYHIMKFYGMNFAPQIQQDDIIADCQSLVLIRSIEKFDETKGNKFNTLYTWWLKSHIRSRKEFYGRRERVAKTRSLDEMFHESNGPDSVTLGDTFSTMDLKVMGRHKKHMADMFGM